ncbi:group II intron reverse transcriptase/maturase [Microaerobacter geothermalis]|uniref:group II intron reverse transcriptase/maturase n=1 Tax=Microaerobacter geothermalis TaxID=674972 RepID=UPI001F1E0739|nr:group II intron reverse transcriptase/maturase [Microaerobacter geothermalis]MCF6095319.1 group II intron reverse transcriptase/maturase [Microaerobacter geothermalis]
MKAEYLGDKGCLQRDSAEREEHAGARSIDNRETEETDGADLLERILDRDNLNRAYERVKANKGAPGIDGMTVEGALGWLREHREELLESIRNGEYKPQPVRRKEIPKPDGGVRKLGIPTVVDRIIQQAIAQQLTPIFEPLFSDNSFGYRPEKSAQMAIQKVKEYAEQGYKHAVLIDLSKYFDTLNHELLMNMVREQVHDKRVTELIKKYLKSGVMENGLLVKTEEGSPQGGPLSPLLANIYLNKFDQEMGGRGVPVIRYADDIVILAKSERAAERLLESGRKYLEGKLKLKVNAGKSKVVSVVAIRNFKFLGFALGRGKNGYYIRAHAKSLKKAKQKLKELTSRSQGRNVRVVMQNVKVYIRGWLGYFGIASMKSTMEEWDGWLRRRLRMYIWKQWKKPKTRVKNLMKLGMPNWQAYRNGNTRKGYWAIAGSGILTHTITNKRLAQVGYYSILDRYESLHLCD